MGSGILPSPMKLINLVSDFRKLSPALPFDSPKKNLSKHHITRSKKLTRSEIEAYKNENEFNDKNIDKTNW